MFKPDFLNVFMTYHYGEVNVLYINL